MELIDDIRGLKRDDAIDFYREVLASGDREAVRYLARNDRFFLLGCVMLRPDVLGEVTQAKDPLRPTDEEREDARRVSEWCYARCREVEVAPDGYLDLWSRYHYKSTIITLAGSVQEILKNPDITIGILSYNKQIAHKFVDQIRRALEMPELTRLFPDVLWPKPPRLNWSTRDGLIVQRKSNPKEPTVSGSGLVDGQPIGAHYALRVYDDVVVESSVTNPEQIRKTTKAWELSQALGTSDGGRAWYVGTRYHPSDTYADILKRGSLKERRRLCMDVEGRPTMMSEKTLKEKQRDMGAFTFSAQMLQNPIAEGVRSFRDEWLVDCVYTTPPPRDAMNVYIFVDGGNSKRKKADRTVMLVIGLNADQNYYWLDGEAGRMNLTERTDALFRLHRKWDPQGVFWEQQGAMSDVAHVEDVMNNRENYRFVITRITRGPLDNKVRRITNLQAPFAQHRLWIPQYRKLLRTYIDENGEATVHDIVQEFVEEEYQTFPNAPHDDFLDAFADILDEQVASKLRWPKSSKSRSAYARKEGEGKDADSLFAR